MEDLLKVGVITTTHGIRGEVKVYPTTDADRFLDLEYVLLDTGREKRKLEIENVKYFKNLVILKFRGIDNINDIEMYKKRELCNEAPYAETIAVLSINEFETIQQDFMF